MKRFFNLIAALVVAFSVFSTPANSGLAQELRELAALAEGEAGALPPRELAEALGHVRELKRLLGDRRGPGSGPGELPHDKCRYAHALAAMVGAGADRSESEQLQRMICANPENPAGMIYYPGGGIAFVAGNYSDAGSWKYPNGKFAFVAGNYSDAGSWKYPNGNYAFVAGNYSDAGSWKYPNGKYAFVAGNYSDAGSYKYSNGKYAFVAGNYSDAGSFKYPNGKYAFVAGNFSDAGRWYYPNGNVFKNDPNFDLVKLVELVEGYTGKRCRFGASALRRFPETVRQILIWSWIEEVLPTE